MVYLDYSATTPVDQEVIETFSEACKYIGNPNSLHKLGVESHELIEAATLQIKKLLNLTDEEIIYTSGASESNNLAIKGVCEKYPNRGKHIITTPLEHSSIYGPINYLVDRGYVVDFVKLDENGLVDLEDLKYLINDETVLVSINAVNSEIGIRQPIEEIGLLLKQYPTVTFHADLTQAIGKIDVDTKNVDMFSFSAHKFFGIKGIGCLIKKNKLMIEPLIHGGKSTTNFRSGTPMTQLIASLSKALRLALENKNAKYQKVVELNRYLKDGLSKYDKVFINSNDYAIPHVVNLSVIGVKPETMLHALEEDNIYISTQSACSANTTVSKAVMSLTKDEKRAASSIRISISYKTTKEEIDYFLKSFDKKIKKLMNLR